MASRIASDVRLLIASLTARSNSIASTMSGSATSAIVDPSACRSDGDSGGRSDSRARPRGVEGGAEVVRRSARAEVGPEQVEQLFTVEAVPRREAEQLDDRSPLATTPRRVRDDPAIDHDLEAAEHPYLEPHRRDSPPFGVARCCMRGLTLTGV